MNHDINIKQLQTNCWRQSKVPGKFMLQLRVPGGTIPVKYLQMASHIADEWGDGNFHMGTRQTLDFPNIDYENIDAVNAYLKEYIEGIEEDLCDVDMNSCAHEKCDWDNTSGYPTIGARNVTACIGNDHCICANVNTQDMAHKVEKSIFPSNYHIKVNVAGCPNDCIKANMCDFGIIGCAKIDFHPERCIGCGACVRACKQGATRVLSPGPAGTPIKDPCCCVGCGECVRACPASAWTRRPEKFYRVMLGGRTGRQTPRAGKMFLNWASEDVVLGVLNNWQKFSAWALDNKPVYMHGGHLIDRAGYHKFKEIILEGVELNPECLVAEQIFWHETENRSNINVMPLADHKTAGPGSQD